jgi:hypothetical protein
MKGVSEEGGTAEYAAQICCITERSSARGVRRPIVWRTLRYTTTLLLNTTGEESGG